MFLGMPKEVGSVDKGKGGSPPPPHAARAVTPERHAVAVHIVKGSKVKTTVLRQSGIQTRDVKESLTS